MSTSLKVDARSPARARALVDQALQAETVPDSLREDVVLVASELVTNSVRSGAMRIEVAVELTPGQLVLTVDDDGAGWPTLVSAKDDDTGGRGLAIVDHLADHWDASSHDDGKRVTAVWSLL